MNGVGRLLHRPGFEPRTARRERHICKETNR